MSATPRLSALRAFSRLLAQAPLDRLLRAYVPRALSLLRVLSASLPAARLSSQRADLAAPAGQPAIGTAVSQAVLGPQMRATETKQSSATPTEKPNSATSTPRASVMAVPLLLAQAKFHLRLAVATTSASPLRLSQRPMVANAESASN